MTPVGAFIADMVAAGAPDPLGTGMTLLLTTPATEGGDWRHAYAVVGILPCPHDPDTTVVLCAVRALPCGQGNGTRAMRYITDLADRHGVAITGYIRPFASKALNVRELQRFYRRHGFSVDRHNNIRRAPASLARTAA